MTGETRSAARSSDEALRELAGALPHTHGLVNAFDPECSPERPCVRCEVEGHLDALLAEIERLREVPEFTVHECSECGYIEGESPQAGCCPRCGIKSDAIPVKVRRV